MRELGRELGQWLLAQGVSVDACGTPVATKWLSHVGPLSELPALPHTEARHERTVPIRHRHWALLTAASLLVVSGGIARTDSFRTPVEAPTPIAMQAPPAPPLAAAAIVLAASPTQPPSPTPSVEPPRDNRVSFAPARRAKQPGVTPVRPHPAAPSRLPF
jgi:hypothetical protein